MPDVTLPSGLRLSYTDQGGVIDPPVVLLPGPTDSWRSYQPVLDRLPSEIHAVSFSQRGHGDSDKPRSGYRVEDFAGDVVPLLDALGIERAVLAGHSGSCLVARRVALDHPERVAALLLEASPATLRNDSQLVDFVQQIAEMEDPISRDFARSFITDTSSADIGADLVSVLVAETLKVPARVWRGTFAGLIEYDDVAQLVQVQAPTLLIWGDADALISQDVQDQLVDLIPDADLLVYRDVGHTPRWADPTRFASDLTRFVTRAADGQH